MAKFTHKYSFEPNMRPGGLKATTFSATGKLFDGFEQYDTVSPLITGVWSSGAGTITLETGTSKIKGLKSLKLVTGGASDTLYRSIDTALFGYPFPGNGIAPAFRYITFRIKTSATTNQTIRLKIWDASDATNSAYIDIVVGNTDYREFCYDLNSKNTESFQAFTFGATWNPALIDRFGFINLPNATTFYLDDIKFHYEHSLVEMIGFGAEAPVEAGDPGSVQAKINALMGYVKGLEGRTYQYSKTSPNELEVGDEAVWALEIMSDFAPPTTTEIVPGVYQIDRVRHGGTSLQVGPAALQTLAGSMYVTYQPGEDVWTEGDLIKVTFSKGVAGLVADEYCVKTDEDPSNALTVDATIGQNHVHVANAYEYQVGWKVRLYEGATTEYLTIDALPDPTTVQFSTPGGLVNNYNDTTATLTRSVWTDLDTAVFYTRLTREPMIEFESNSFFESDREDGAHTQVGDNVHWDFQNYKVGGGTQTGGISGGKVNISVADAGDYCARDLYSFKSKYFRMVTDLDVTWTSLGAAGGSAGLGLYKGAAYDLNNNIEVKRYKDNAANNVVNAFFVIGGVGVANVDVNTTDDAVALMLERNDRTWRAWYSLTKDPDYEWTLITEVDDAADAVGEQTSAVLFVRTGNAGATVAGAFDNFKYIINDKFLEQMYDSPEIVPIVDKQVDPRVDQNTGAGGMEIFRVGLMDIRDGLPTAGEITPGTTLVNRYREGTDAGWVPQGAETITNASANGYIRAVYDFTSVGAPPMWKPGDQAQFTLSGVKVTDATTGRVYNVPDLAIYMVVGGPPNADESQNLWLGDVIGNKADAIPDMDDAPGAWSIEATSKAILERVGATPADGDDSLLTINGQRDDAAPAMNAAPTDTDTLVKHLKAIRETVGQEPADADDSLHTINGQRDDAAPAMNAAPTDTDTIIKHLKAIRETVGQEPADADDSLHTNVGQRDDAATADSMADVTTTSIEAKLRLILNRLSTNAFTATINGSARVELDLMLAQLAAYIVANGAAISSVVDPGGSTRTDLETVLEDLGKILAGGGISTFPAAANPGNGVSMAAVLRAVITSLVGGDDLDSWTNINNTANTSLNAALQNFAVMFGATGVNSFNPTIQGAARTDLDVALAQLAIYFAAGGAAIAATVDPGGTERATLELILEDIGKMMAGGGITTWPAGALAGNGVSMAAAIKGITNALGIVAAAGVGFEVDGTGIPLSKAVIGDATITWATAASIQRCLLDMPYVIPHCISPADCVIDGPNNVKFKVELTNIRTDADVIQAGEIAPGTITISRFRPGVDADYTAIVTAAACTANAGFVTYNYTFPSASWQSGDVYTSVMSSIVVTIAGQVFQIPPMRVFGTVASSATVDDVYGKDHPVLKSVFNTTVTTKAGSVTLFNLTSPDRALKDIAVEFFLDDDALATFTPEWYVDRAGDPGTLTVRYLPAVTTIVTPASDARYRYTYGDLPAGAQLEFRVAQDNAGDATNVIDAVLTYLE